MPAVRNQGLNRYIVLFEHPGRLLAVACFVDQVQPQQSGRAVQKQGQKQLTGDLHIPVSILHIHLSQHFPVCQYLLLRIDNRSTHCWPFGCCTGSARSVMQDLTASVHEYRLIRIPYRMRTCIVPPLSGLPSQSYTLVQMVHISRHMH